MTEALAIALGYEGIILAPGAHRTTCPRCSRFRGKSQETCLRVWTFPDRAEWLCYHDECGWSGVAFPD